MKKEKNRAGFTLLELLISIVIVSIIITTMFSALRLGLDVWERGEKDVDLTHRIRIVKGQIKSQVASVCTQIFFTGKAGGETSPFLLKGTDTTMEFISRYSISPDSGCNLVYAKYYSKTRDVSDNLMMFEKDLCIINDQELIDIQDADNEDSGHILLQGVDGLLFEYLGKNKDGGMEWRNSWNMGFSFENGFPVAVKISFSIKEIPVSIIAKIMSDVEKPE